MGSHVPNRRSGTLTPLLAVLVLLAGCSPAIYQKPLEDFRAANLSVREAYFLQLDQARDARASHDVLLEETVLWQPDRELAAADLEDIARRVAEIRNEPLLPPDTRNLREAAFRAIDGYAGTLVALASDDDTQGIVTELNALVGDINGVLENARNLGLVSNAASRAKEFAGPLSSIAGALGTIAEIVSGVVRERAIRQTVVSADARVRELLGLLKGEAVWARREAVRQSGLARDRIRGFIERNGDALDSATRATVTGRAERIYTLASAMEDQQGLEAAFDAAIEAQAALVRKAALKDQEDWILRIQSFRAQVTAAKASLEQVRSSF